MFFHQPVQAVSTQEIILQQLELLAPLKVSCILYFWIIQCCALCWTGVSRPNKWVHVCFIWASSNHSCVDCVLCLLVWVNNCHRTETAKYVTYCILLMRGYCDGVGSAGSTTYYLCGWVFKKWVHYNLKPIAYRLFLLIWAMLCIIVAIF